MKAQSAGHISNVNRCINAINDYDRTMALSCLNAMVRIYHNESWIKELSTIPADDDIKALLWDIAEHILPYAMVEYGYNRLRAIANV